MTATRAYRDLLANRPLARLLFGEFVSSIGDWLYLVALLVVVYQRSQDPLLLGIVGAARVLPYVFLSVPAGFVADRFDRRLVLLVTDVARGLLMLVLAWLVATDGPVEAVVGLAILATCFSTFFGPAIGAYIPALVRDERELGPANSAWATLDNLAFALGPAIAGILVGIGGLAVAFVLNAVSFGIVALVLAGLPSARAMPEGAPADSSPAAVASVAGETAPGRGRLTAIAGLGLIDLVGSFAFGGVGILTVTLAITTYGAGEAGIGLLNAAIGIGGIVGAVVSGWLALRTSLGPVLVGGAVATGLGIAALGASPLLVVGFGALVVASAGSLVLEVIGTTLLQRAAPDAIRGRVLGVLATTSTLAYAAGAFLIPVLADELGLEPVLIAASIGLVGAAFLGAGFAAPSTRLRPVDADRVALLAALPIFSGMSPMGLERAAANLQARAVRSGDRVIGEGEVADRFYVAERGLFRVTQRGVGEERFIRDLPAPTSFGEIGLLRGSPRTASVTALADGQLLELDGAEFLRLVAEEAGIGPRLLDLHRGGARLGDASPTVSGG